MERHFTTDPRAAARQAIPARNVPINDLLAALVAELEAEGITAPLVQPLTLGFVWADLCRLAGEEPPPAVAAMLDEPVAA